MSTAWHRAAQARQDDVLEILRAARTNSETCHRETCHRHARDSQERTGRSDFLAPLFSIRRGFYSGTELGRRARRVWVVFAGEPLVLVVTISDPGLLPDVKTDYSAFSDLDLLRRGSGEGEAFGVFYDRHIDGVLEFFMSRTACPETSADLAGEVFAQALVARRRYRKVGPRNARPWILGIARNLLSNYYRSQAVAAKYRAKLGIADLDYGSGELRRVEDLFDSSGLLEKGAAALKELSVGEREAVRLRVMDDRAYEEVAALLGCSEGAARVRVSRGLSKLLVIMEDT